MVRFLKQADTGGGTMQQSSDVTLAKHGDSDAFRRLLTAYSPLMTSLANQFYSDEIAADAGIDDLMQEASIALYNAVMSYTEGKNTTFGLYAKICIKNRLVSFLRHVCAKNSNIGKEALEKLIDSSVMPNEDIPLERLISGEEVECLQKKIRSALTDYEYSVFLLIAKGAATSEAAAILNVGEKSVLNAMARAKAKLRKII
jgi:RNA polymerase sporulation-specific sigma factor